MEGLLIGDKNNGGSLALQPAAVLNEQGDNQDRGENPNDLHGRNIQTNFAAWGERKQFKFGADTKGLCTTSSGTVNDTCGSCLLYTSPSPRD